MPARGDGDSGQGRGRFGTPCVRRAIDTEEGRRNKVASPCPGPGGQAAFNRYLGGRVVGYRVLSAERIHRRPSSRQGSPAPDILVNPCKTDRDLGCSCRWPMDGSSTSRFSGCLIDSQRCVCSNDSALPLDAYPIEAIRENALDSLVHRDGRSLCHCGCLSADGLFHYLASDCFPDCMARVSPTKTC